MEIICVVSFVYLVDECIETNECPLVEFCELIVRYAVLFRIEACAVAKVTEYKSSALCLLMRSLS